MNFLIRYFRRSPKAAFTPLSIFLLGAVFVSSFGFWSCSKKDYTTQDEIPTGTLEVKNNVSIDEAKRVYEAYLKQKPKNSRTLNVRGDEDVEAQIIWESAQSYNYTDTSGNLISTSTNVYIKGEIKKIFFARVYDTVKLLQVYIHPTEEYIKHHNGTVQMNDFDGFVGYRDDHDVFLGGYKFENGQVVGQLVPKTNKLKSRGASEGSILLDAVTVTADRPSTWQYTHTSLMYVHSINGGGVGPLNLPRNGNSGNGGNGGNDSGSSTGGSGYSGAYGGIVISPSLYHGRNPTDFLFEMGVRRGAIAYVLERDKKLGIQIGEALDFLGTDDIKETIETFVVLIQTNKDFQDANIEDNYSFRIFLSLHKYLKAGFSGVEFVSLFLDKELFAQVDGFLTQNVSINNRKVVLDKIIKPNNQTLSSSEKIQRLQFFNKLKSSLKTQLEQLAQDNTVSISSSGDMDILMKIFGKILGKKIGKVIPFVGTGLGVEAAWSAYRLGNYGEAAFELAGVMMDFLPVGILLETGWTIVDIAYTAFKAYAPIAELGSFLSSNSKVLDALIETVDGLNLFTNLTLLPKLTPNSASQFAVSLGANTVDDFLFTLSQHLGKSWQSTSWGKLIEFSPDFKLAYYPVDGSFGGPAISIQFNGATFKIRLQ